MRTLIRMIFSLYISICMFPMIGRSATMKAGAAKVDITPPLGLTMYGYGGRKEGATGILDPLYARVLVLEAGDQRVAMVVCDLGRPFAPAWIERLRRDAKEKYGISYLVQAAIHTHAGPDIPDEYPPLQGPDWETPALEKIERAVGEAEHGAVEARLGTGYGVAYIGHNRLREQANGRFGWFMVNPTMVPTAPVDPTVSILRIDNASGKPIAILVNYACHPVVFGPDNRQYSADWPGVMDATVDRALAGEGPGAGPICFFLQGGDGDINPFFAVTPLDQNAVGRRDWTGNRLGEVAARVAKDIVTKPEAEASLQFTEDLLDVHLRWDADKFRAAILASWGAEEAENFDRHRNEPMRLPVGTILINKRIAFMTMPGEPFVDFQTDWRNRCPVPDAFFMGYSNGDFGYFPTVHAASLGGYGAASTATRVEVGAGERMVNQALVRVYEMLGRLTDVPEDLGK
ncbi:MAG: neutral/alkaline non-lysosomal ceramidase N-terminal domain-containing protein [Terriglobia bacterium]|jgi:neutral ceramidase